MNHSAWIAQLYEAESAGIFRFVCGMMRGDRSLAEDLTSRTFQKAVEHADALARADSPRAWLIAVARNEVRMSWRHQGVVAAARRLLDRDRHAAPGGADGEWLDLIALLGRMSASDREIILLIGLVELTAEEAGAAVGVTAEAAQKRWRRARGRLLALAERGEGPSYRAPVPHA